MARAVSPALPPGRCASNSVKRVGRPVVVAAVSVRPSTVGKDESSLSSSSGRAESSYVDISYSFGRFVRFVDTLSKLERKGEPLNRPSLLVGMPRFSVVTLLDGFAMAVLL
jgi:hypothetical protein